MNHKIIIACAALSISPVAATALPTSFYSPTSLMAKGKWVRIGVEQTGVYEITYDQLREMGFSNPQAVAVYGGGGRQMSEMFTDASGNPLVFSDIPSVRVLHADNKIYFYGLGTEDVRFVANESLQIGGSFLKQGRNIYSSYGYYFLTDAAKPVAPEKSAASADEGAAPLTKGVGYVYHELDLAHNSTNTGQLYWGEDYFKGPNLNTWNVELHDLLGGEAGAMECKFYTSKGLNSNITKPDEQIWLGYGVGKNVKEGTPAAHFPVENQTNISDYIPQEPSLSGFTIPAGTDKVFVEYELGHTRSFDLSALDHWVLTYPKGIPTLRNAKGQKINQDLIAFPEMTVVGETRIFELNDPGSKSVWDVTDPLNPVELQITVSGGKGTVAVTRGAGDSVPTIAVFDRTSSQKQISGFRQNWTPVENQDIHALQQEGCDMAIITLPKLLDSAKKIAALHEREYGDKVVVVTADQVYNEFSGGVPDPMAYRSMVKMFYSSPGRKIKNLMLIGPIYADARGMKTPVDPDNVLIAYQTNELNLETTAMNANDILGMMTDYFNVKTIEKQAQHVGVGILPVYTTEELERYVAKLEKYMTDESYAYRLTSSLHIGGIGDNHIHDNQAVNLASYNNDVMSSSAVSTVIAIDAYGYEQSRNKWFEAFNNGRHFATYFGHGAASYLGQNRMFFTAANVNQFKNTPLPFMFFFGCTISQCDLGIRGLGESMVFDTEHGVIGTLLATRSTWSGQNFDFSKLLFTSFYNTSANSTVSNSEEKSITLGEVVKKAKNISLYANEMTYQLLADPGLIVPVALQRVSCTAPKYVAPGQTLKYSGSVQKVGSSSIDTDFNGEIVLRVFEPEFDMVAEDLLSGSGNDPLKVTYGDNQVTMSSARVVNGKFEMEVVIPQQVSEFEGRNLRFNFCAYNHKTRTGASCTKTSEINTASQTVRPAADVTAPVIESLAYIPETKTISVLVSDNVALDLSRNMLTGSFQASIDGQYAPEGSASDPILYGDGPRLYKREFYIGALTAGEHSARVIVKDAAGNQTEGEITFTTGPDAARFSLALREVGLTDRATFFVEGQAPDAATIYITSAEGTEITTLPFKAGQEVVWNGNDASGNRVAPGRYRAFMRETGSNTTKGHTAEIVVPVI